MKDIKNKIKNLSVKSDENWRKEAKERRDKKWLIYSAEIAARILSLIEDNEELNQSRLADALNVSRQQINKIIQGKENLTLETIYNLSQALKFELITFPDYKDSYRMLGPRIENMIFKVDKSIAVDTLKNYKPSNASPGLQKVNTKEYHTEIDYGLTA